MALLSVKNIAGSGSTDSGDYPWSIPGRVKASDDSRTTKAIPDNGGVTTKLHAYNFGFDIPPTAIITGILVEIEHKTNAGKVQDYTLYLRDTDGTTIGNNFASSTDWLASSDEDEIVSYGGEFALFGAELTSTIVNNINFGISLQAINSSTGTGSKTVFVDAIWITIYYNYEYAKCPLTWMIPGGQEGFSLSSTEQQRTDFLSTISSNLELNPYIDKVFITAHWKNIEPTEGEFFWTYLDNVIDLVVSKGMSFKFGLVPGVNCPDWIFSNNNIDLFNTIGSNPYRSTYGQPLQIPVPWNEIYQEKWFAALTALASHFTTKGYMLFCEEIVLSPWSFQSGELHLPNSSTDIANWNSIGVMTNLPLAMEATLEHYTTTFPDQRLCIQTLWNILKSSTLTQNIMNIALEGCSDKLNVQHNTMHGKSSLVMVDRWRGLRDWKAAYPDIQIGSQSLAFMRLPVDTISERQGTTRLTCENVRDCSADAYFEIWYGNGKDIQACRAITTLLAGENYTDEDYISDDDPIDDGTDDVDETDWRWRQKRLQINAGRVIKTIPADFR